MNAEQSAIWRRIEGANLIGPEEDELFLRKLEVQNGWSREFTERCVAEYLKFVFLAVAAGHPVSPPDAVDQVWHLHLTYTRAYWKVFCPEVLGQPLHHSPSNGGSAEAEKFEEWYENTLKSYRISFGAEATDIWPDASRKAKEDRRPHRRVDTNRHWVIPKPVWLFRQVGVVIGAWMMLLAVGCSTLGSQNRWNVEGPTFLFMYITLLAVAISVCVSVRRGLTKVPFRTKTEWPKLNLYEWAFLAGGARRLLQAIIVRLHGAQAVALDEKGKVVGTGELREPLDPVESEVRQCVATGAKTRDELRDALQSRLSAMQERLERAGLLVRAADSRKARAVAVLLMGVVLGVGLLRLWQGFVSNKPIGILAFLMVVGLGTMLWLLQGPFRTQAGDCAVEKLQETHGKNRWRSSDESGLLSGAQLALVVGLMGISTLKGTPLEKIESKLGPASGGGCGGGCGGSSCGGGGCGGGCGGCGG